MVLTLAPAYITPKIIFLQRHCEESACGRRSNLKFGNLRYFQDFRLLRRRFAAPRNDVVILYFFLYCKFNANFNPVLSGDE